MLERGIVCLVSGALALVFPVTVMVSLGYTITGKTADLTVVQKTINDTLHKEGKTQTFIAKEAGCSQSAVYKHVNRKLSGRKKCGRKRCTTNRENRSLMRIVKQNPFKNLGELHKEWTEAGVKASRATTHRRVEEFSYSWHQRRLTWAKEKKNWIQLHLIYLIHKFHSLSWITEINELFHDILNYWDVPVYFRSFDVVHRQ